MTQTFEAMRLLSDAKRSGIKYGDIADYMRVSPSLVSMWLHGNAEPSRDQMRALRKLEHAKWSVVKLSSPSTLQVFYITTMDARNCIPFLLEQRNTTPAGIFCKKVRNTVQYEELLTGASKSEANTVKRALDKEARRPHLSRTRSGEPHPRPARIGAACVSPSAAAPTSLDNENS